MALAHETKTRTDGGRVTYPSDKRVNDALDPLPWVHYYDKEDRAQSNDLPGSLRTFKPRPGYEQDRMKYRLGQRW